jgi:Protein of unknown function (DUF3892)
MAIRITAIRQEGGSGDEHITHLWWEGDGSAAEIIRWIEDKQGSAYVDDGLGHKAQVGVVTTAAGRKYLRTHADGYWTDNLASLPRR